LVLSVFGSGVALTKLLASLFFIWLTLDWKVRKARKALEKELMKQGMSKRDAKRMGAQYAGLKDNIKRAFKQYMRR
jgi:DNA polymerase III delta prime subunit